MDFLGRSIAALTSALEFHFRLFWREWLIGLVALFSCSYALYAISIAPPPDFPIAQTISVKKGSPLRDIARELARDHVIAHPLLFEGTVRLLGGGVQAGLYRFAAPENALQIARRLVSGDSGIPEIRITFPEGTTVRDMAALVAKRFPDISESEFVAAAGPYEGYLFPDTYRFTPSATAGDIVDKIRANFEAKTAPLMADIAKSGHSISEIVIMASILEREGKELSDMRMISGILWHRITIGLPLQVDAVFGYIQGRATYSPSLVDLSIDSPYNTYKHKGLPPGAISNPGLNALRAAATPQQSNYVFYLTGRDGQMRYAVTYAAHLANQRAYLR